MAGEIDKLIKETIKKIPHISAADMSYVLGERWKCDKSPSDAHHWVEDKKDGSGTFECKYCHERRKFPIYWWNGNAVLGRED